MLRSAVRYGAGTGGSGPCALSGAGVALGIARRTVWRSEHERAGATPAAVATVRRLSRRQRLGFHPRRAAEGRDAGRGAATLAGVREANSTRGAHQLP